MSLAGDYSSVNVSVVRVVPRVRDRRVVVAYKLVDGVRDLFSEISDDSARHGGIVSPKSILSFGQDIFRRVDLEHAFGFASQKEKPVAKASAIENVRVDENSLDQHLITVPAGGVGSVERVSGTAQILNGLHASALAVGAELKDVAAQKSSV